MDYIPHIIGWKVKRVLSSYNVSEEEDTEDGLCKRRVEEKEEGRRNRHGSECENGCKMRLQNKWEKLGVFLTRQTMQQIKCIVEGLESRAPSPVNDKYIGSLLAYSMVFSTLLPIAFMKHTFKTDGRAHLHRGDIPGISNELLSTMVRLL